VQRACVCVSASKLVASKLVASWTFGSAISRRQAATPVTHAMTKELSSRACRTPRAGSSHFVRVIAKSDCVPADRAAGAPSNPWSAAASEKFQLGRIVVEQRGISRCHDLSRAFVSSQRPISALGT
jgi:hypothetical protein